MNNKISSESERHRTLQILDELSGNDSMTQRDLSTRLGIALGLVNSYIKNLVSKGYITVKSIPPRRYVYYLTPKGFAEKTRLTYHLLQDYTRIYKQARFNIRKLFSELQSAGSKRIVFAGADEVAEIAYITLQETELELAGVVDDSYIGKRFFDFDVSPLKDIKSIQHDSVIVTTFVNREKIYQELMGNNVHKQNIRLIFDT